MRVPDSGPMAAVHSSFSPVLAWYSSTVNWRFEAAVSRPGVRLWYLVNQSLVEIYPGLALTGIVRIMLGTLGALSWHKREPSLAISALMVPSRSCGSTSLG